MWSPVSFELATFGQTQLGWHGYLCLWRFKGMAGCCRIRKRCWPCFQGQTAGPLHPAMILHAGGPFCPLHLQMTKGSKDINHLCYCRSENWAHPLTLFSYCPSLPPNPKYIFNNPHGTPPHPSRITSAFPSVFSILLQANTTIIHLQ